MTPLRLALRGAMTATFLLSAAYALTLAKNIALMVWKFGADDPPATYIFASNIGLFFLFGALAMTVCVASFWKTRDDWLLGLCVGHGVVMTLSAMAVAARLVRPMLEP